MPPWMLAGHAQYRRWRQVWLTQGKPGSMLLQLKFEIAGSTCMSLSWRCCCVCVGGEETTRLIYLPCAPISCTSLRRRRRHRYYAVNLTHAADINECDPTEKMIMALYNVTSVAAIDDYRTHTRPCKDAHHINNSRTVCNNTESTYECECDPQEANEVCLWLHTIRSRAQLCKITRQ